MVLTALLLTIAGLAVDFSLLTSVTLNLTNVLWRGAFGFCILFCTLALSRSRMRRAKAILEIRQDKADNDNS